MAIGATQGIGTGMVARPVTTARAAQSAISMHPDAKPAGNAQMISAKTRMFGSTQLENAVQAFRSAKS